MHDSENPAPVKRNCGRTGPTSPEGRAASSKNSTKHGACARTLILPHESEEDWEEVLAHWCRLYQPAKDSLEYDFVLKTAQAEWHRIRAQHNFNNFLASTEGGSSFNWRPEQIKQHDLALRYKNAAERAFQRDYRLLEQHYKTHHPKPAKEPAPKEEKKVSSVLFTVEDPTSPGGQRPIQRCFLQSPGPET
jgi:hypothetical protein